ncbi:MAG: hypothetical protein E6J79_09670 [Deltaproteobacteria bacterium]|nr:MAG: hypothetical protein E6J79_09670 [Deltaproteobacteria bacterium]
MTEAVARAPGKLFLSGEYVVLMGAPAVLAAVDRYAEVRVGFGEKPGPLVVTSLAEGTRWEAPVARNEMPGGDAGAVLAALHAVAERGGIAAHLGADVTVDSRPFLVGERKLGLGRSSATLVAAVAAFLATAGRPTREGILERALAANALFQEGRGSGADLAAAVHGGLVEVRRKDAALRVQPRTLPRGVHLVAGWTGESAPTGLLLARFAAATAYEPRSLGPLREVAARAAEAIERGDAQSLADAVDRSADLLERLGSEVDIPIVTPALARLVATARRVGAVAKPSGAGAGDCGIALAGSAAQAARVRAAWQEVGIVPLSVEIAPEGVTGG